MADFGFVGGAYQAASLTQNASECINWYPEVDQSKPEGARGVVALYPTPGIDPVVEDFPEAEVRELFIPPGGESMVAVVGNTVYNVAEDYTHTALGTLSTSAGRVSITDNGQALYITDGPNRYYYVWSTGTFATVDGADGPFIGADVCDVVDNYVIYNNPGSSQWGCTDVSSVTSGTLNLGQKIGYPDDIISLVADHRQILLLGEKYSERWIDVGTFPFPFAVIPGSSLQHGLEARWSVARLGEGIAFLSKDSRGNATVVMWGAALPSPQRISTYAIENAIQNYPDTADAIAYTYTQSGHEFYVLTFPVSDVTWVYDLSTGFWHRRAWRDPDSGVYKRHRSNCAAVFNGEVLVGDFENGKIYRLSQTVYTDDGDPLPCVRRCRHLTTDLKRQFFHDLQIQFQPGVGLQTGQGSDPTCILRWSDDGGFTFGNDRTVTIGKAGKYRHRAIKRRLGWARDRVYEVVVTDPVYRVVVSANLNASTGAN